MTNSITLKTFGKKYGWTQGGIKYRFKHHPNGTPNPIGKARALNGRIVDAYNEEELLSYLKNSTPDVKKRTSNKQRLAGDTEAQRSVPSTMIPATALWKGLRT